MTQHVADRLLAAIVAQLQAAGLVVAIDAEPPSLPGVILENIEDELLEMLGPDPMQQTRKLAFDLFACDKASSATLAQSIGTQRHAVTVALMGSRDARTLGGLTTRPLIDTAATYRTDTERMEQPVGGWSIHFELTYGLRPDQPGQVEKE
jgi:hypothetical protein